MDPSAVNAEGKIWYLDSVCWLEGRFNLNVHPGKYAVAIRMKLDAFNFNAVWKIGQNVNAKSIGKSETYLVTKERDCILYQHGQGKGELKKMKNGQWFWMYFGDHFELL